MEFSQTGNDPQQAGNITQNYNLSFQIGNNNLYGRTSDGNSSSSDNVESSARAATGDQNGRSRDKGHGENQESRCGYSSPNASVQGRPPGISLMNNECLDGVQEIETSALFPGDEAVRQPVKMSGRSHDKSHSTRRSQLADPTEGFTIHPQVVRLCNRKEIDSPDKIRQLLTESYPVRERYWKEHRETERLAISIIQTCVAPSNLGYREQSQFSTRIRAINRFRRSKGIPCLPQGLLRVKIQTLLPRIATFTCSDDDRDEHRERVRLINREYEILDWIISGDIHLMSMEERNKIERELPLINELRREEGGVPLDLSKTHDGHFFEEEEEENSEDVEMADTEANVNENIEVAAASYRNDNTNDSDSSSSDSDSDSDYKTDSDGDNGCDSKPRAREDVTMDEVLDLCEDKKKKAVKEKPKKEELRDGLVGKKLKLFLKELDTMTKCPLSLQRFKHPCIASDNQVYERAKITEWLKVKPHSPMTRKEMKKSSLKYDHTMQKFVQAFADFKITSHVLENLKCAPEGTSSKVLKEDSSQLPEKRKSKKARHDKNYEAKEIVKQKLKIHRNFLKSIDFYKSSNYLTYMPPTPSYSIMHSLQEGFSILMYSGSHRVNLHPGLHLHHCNAVKIILPPNMMIIWHEALFHAGAKSRKTPQGAHKEDLRFFSYIWPKVDYPPDSRMHGRTDGVLRESGDQVYREDITHKICPQMYKARPTCQHCMVPSQVLDLREIADTSYASGDWIIGDLDEYGWMVVRGVRMSQDMYKALNYVKNFGQKSKVIKRPQWFSIEDRNNNRVMKYNHTSTVHDEWREDPHLKEFLSKLEHTVIKKALKIDEKIPTKRKPADYMIGKYNLLMNRSEVSCDQQAHTDYRERIAT